MRMGLLQTAQFRLFQGHRNRPVMAGGFVQGLTAHRRFGPHSAM